MGLRISTNMSSIMAQRSMSTNQRELNKSYAQLSSGSRITQSADDAAGLSISETLKSTVRGYQQANRNANDAVSMVQVSEGGLGEISNILTRMRELGVQAASDTVGEQERGFIDKEVQQMKAEVQRISQTTKWGSTNLLDGSGSEFSFQVDLGNDDFNDRIAFKAADQNATTSNLGIDGFDYTDKEGARSALTVIEGAQRQINGFRANLGAIQNRLITTSSNLGTSIENFSAANSRIRDTDVAASTADLARNNIMNNASINVLAQANQQPNAAMALLRS
jgi:flagellin